MSAPLTSPLTSLLALTDRVAVVTGGAAGMGRATATRLAEAGAAVVIADLDGDRAAAAAAEISAAGGSASAQQLDVSDADAVGALAERTFREAGRLDVWVNNAGIFPPTPLFRLTPADWDRMLDVNTRSVFFGTREAARWMIAGGRGGVVVNIASIAAYRAGSPNQSHYAASKAAVVTLTKTLSSALGRHGVRVVGVAPGVIATDGVLGNLGTMDAQGLNLADRGATVPLQRTGDPDDIARMVVVLASDLAAYVTGVTVPVDGGDLVTGKADTLDLDALGYDTPALAGGPTG
jgi:NAD(P)-dependent dehydrogenase (short-subunit alcohol dehydrogenase family)